MQADASGPAPEISHAITYEAFAGNDYNLDFRGQGRLVIRPAGPSYAFSGPKREMFSARQEATLELGVDDIWNVVTDGRTIRFQTRRGQSGAKGRPFVFLCRDAGEAAAVAALLPARQDADFVETRDFSVRLNALPGAASPWTSATNLLVAANVAVFILLGFLGAGWFEVESMMPYVRYGANNGGATTDGEWWRLVTCMFMHYGLIHLAMNMWALFQTGHLLEKLLGRTLYALAYFGSGIIAGLASLLWHGDKIWSAGASGAVFGIYGALLGYMFREKHGLPRAVFQPIMRSTLFFAGYNILFGLAHPRIDNSAHVGGFLSGIALGWLVALPVDPAARARWFPRRLREGLAGAALLIAAGVALVPRFDYHLAEELQWGEVRGEFAAREAEVLQRQQKEWARFQTGEDRAAYARWIETDLVPLYEPWARRLESMNLAPGKVTARRRDIVLRFIKLRLEGFRHLLAGVRDRNEAEIRIYEDLDRRAKAELEKLPAARQ